MDRRPISDTEQAAAQLVMAATEKPSATLVTFATKALLRTPPLRRSVTWVTPDDISSAVTPLDVIWVSQLSTEHIRELLPNASETLRAAIAGCWPNHPDVTEEDLALDQPHISEIIATTIDSLRTGKHTPATISALKDNHNALPLWSEDFIDGLDPAAANALWETLACPEIPERIRVEGAMSLHLHYGIEMKRHAPAVSLDVLHRILTNPCDDECGICCGEEHTEHQQETCDHTYCDTWTYNDAQTLADLYAEILLTQLGITLTADDLSYDVLLKNASTQHKLLPKETFTEAAKSIEVAADLVGDSAVMLLTALPLPEKTFTTILNRALVAERRYTSWQNYGTALVVEDLTRTPKPIAMHPVLLWLSGMFATKVTPELLLAVLNNVPGVINQTTLDAVCDAIDNYTEHRLHDALHNAAIDNTPRGGLETVHAVTSRWQDTISNTQYRRLVTETYLHNTNGTTPMVQHRVLIEAARRGKKTLYAVVSTHLRSTKHNPAQQYSNQMLLHVLRIAEAHGIKEEVAGIIVDHVTKDHTTLLATFSSFDALPLYDELTGTKGFNAIDALEQLYEPGDRYDKLLATLTPDEITHLAKRISTITGATAVLRAGIPDTTAIDLAEAFARQYTWLESGATDEVTKACVSFLQELLTRHTLPEPAIARVLTNNYVHQYGTRIFGSWLTGDFPLNQPSPTIIGDIDIANIVTKIALSPITTCRTSESRTTILGVEGLPAQIIRTCRTSLELFKTFFTEKELVLALELAAESPLSFEELKETVTAALH